MKKWRVIAYVYDSEQITDTGYFEMISEDFYSQSDAEVFRFRLEGWHRFATIEVQYFTKCNTWVNI